jgi:Tfp pilus assembly protein PilF
VNESASGIRKIEDQIAAPLAELAHAYAMSGRRAEAGQALDELLARSRRSHVSKYVIATVYAALGEKGQAFGMLDMKFQDLLRRMNFPPQAR